ncbi:MAG TPA: RNA-guided pseudouridylation complex pseudouridine synthase subunit Cbf5 [Halobacteriales archaeon]|uniref:RNA-guided pseudouridylation complex pseudouridine synthase subunit Cbf5 n=1 Tax=Candidatus Hikarchaeum yamanae TaxID=2675326 RepID=UPI0018537623|nr:RNA-guided pseudouridylation complex pseudouridine synthase subunit Cbf5 [Halobacteriales archaeon]|tara:strand:+ start:38551 stop:39435 length:885 start_codon:yes stop_codon:yes gene_type:complete
MKLREPPEDRSISELMSFGVINIDKPIGPSSHQISAWVREIVKVGKTAHSGTLDPKVTGCLPILLGDATRLSKLLLGKKEYIVVLELHDEGKDETELSQVLEEFKGEIYQKPPKKSAVSRKVRVREIYDIELLEIKGRKALLRVECESGTYIRKLCHDIGLILGQGAHMGDLRRTKSYPFDDGELSKLHELVDAVEIWKQEGNEELIREIIHPAESILEGIPKIIISQTAAMQVANGAPVYAPGIISAEKKEILTEGMRVVCYTQGGSAVCLGEYTGKIDSKKGKVVELERVLV